MSKHEEMIAELEKQRDELLRKCTDLNFNLHRANVRIEELKTCLTEEKQKYTDLLERYITMMEKVVKIDDQRKD